MSTLKTVENGSGASRPGSSETEQEHIRSLLHQLWTWDVGRPGYEKRKWLEFERFIEDRIRGRPAPEGQARTCVQRDRLVKLARFLREQVPAERFDLGTWATGPLQECGTAGCAGGWATVLFHEDGLVLKPVQMGQQQSFIDLVPSFGTAIRYAALERFFGLSALMASWIFMRYYYEKGSQTTPVEVAARIEAFLAGHGEPKLEPHDVAGLT